MADLSCTCTVFDDTPCSRDMTQEDLLCDPCRKYQEARRKIDELAHRGQTGWGTGPHSMEGAAGSPRPHTQGALVPPDPTPWASHTIDRTRALVEHHAGGSPAGVSHFTAVGGEPAQHMNAAEITWSAVHPLASAPVRDTA